MLSERTLGRKVVSATAETKVFGKIVVSLEMLPIANLVRTQDQSEHVLEMSDGDKITCRTNMIRFVR